MSVEKQFIARKIKWQDQVLVNICDEELLGTTVKGGNTDMEISRDYFWGDKVDAQEALDLIRTSSIINLAGTRIVERTVREKLATERAVKRVGSVSFLMIYKFTH